MQLNLPDRAKKYEINSNNSESEEELNSME